MPSDIPPQYVVRESDHRIHDPLSAAKLGRLGEALRLPPGATVLDLGSGSGEMLCTWARDHGVRGVGVDLSSAFTEAAVSRSLEVGVSDAVRFEHAEGAAWVAARLAAGGEPFDVVACLGATWIGGDLFGTVDLLASVLRPGGLLLVGHPFWERVPETDDVARRCHAEDRTTWQTLSGLLAAFAEHGLDVVQMVLADRDDWDVYVAAQWLSTRRWLDAHADDDPPHELWAEMRTELDTAPVDHATYQRTHLGWGVFALMPRPVV
ncbi:class I SAM-dependent methyltransferase [Nocardioides marinquilinus]|uniref:Class I SAM-dependent methyltransferase n=1 Tax=Nocardioides marinquilinus TaxID=1210400 RepID=A0ABP9PYI8_9ACTN